MKSAPFVPVTSTRRPSVSLSSSPSRICSTLARAASETSRIVAMAVGFEVVVIVLVYLACIFLRWFWIEAVACKHEQFIEHRNARRCGCDSV